MRSEQIKLQITFVEHCLIDATLTNCSGKDVTSCPGILIPLRNGQTRQNLLDAALIDSIQFLTFIYLSLSLSHCPDEVKKHQEA